MEGIGNLSKFASLAAAINPSVETGKSARAIKLPIKGVNEKTESIAMNMKKRPLRATGCFQNVLIPNLTQMNPFRAGTTFNFMVYSLFV